MKLTIGTRGSALALWQAHYAQTSLKKVGVDSELEVIKTQGDIIQHLSFDKLEGKGFFTKEIEEHLLDKKIDLAVHSLKDMPTASHPDLILGAVSYREDPADWLIIGKEAVDPRETLKIRKGARIGTSSNRRKAQLLDWRPDLAMVDIRGNVATRLHKINEGAVDGVVLAAAGLSRLETDLSEYEVVRFHPREFIPAPGQGILTFQTRKDRTDVRKVLMSLHHSEVGMRSNMERTVLQKMGGGCSMPLGVYCEVDDMKNYHVWAAFSPGLDYPLKRVQVSSATSVGLADEIISRLKTI